MFDDVDRALCEWIATVATDADVVLHAPAAEVERPTISLYLVELRSGVPTRREASHLEVVMRYLVSATASDPALAHRLLGQLLFAAFERPDVLVELATVDAALWRAFGVAPRPAFFLQRPYTFERAQRAPRIRMPAEIQVQPVGDLTGVVLSPTGVPIVRARVELVDTGAVVYTDDDGRFRFAAVPMRATPRPLRIFAKGTELEVSQRARPDESLVIRFQPEEA
jgi:hypothetical protein